MKYVLFFLAVASSWFFWGCQKESYITPTDFNDELLGAKSIDNAILKKMEGVYKAGPDNSVLGKDFVCLANNDYLTLISNRGGLYAIMQLKLRVSDSSLIGAGFWRTPNGTSIGAIKLTAPVTWRALANGDFRQVGFMLYHHNSLTNKNLNETPIKFERPFSATVLNKDFLIVAHRGGGRNSDNLLQSENSTELIKKAALFGANGIEIDVKLTKDRIPVLYHDDDLNTRLTKKSPLIGNINQYTYGVLTQYVELIHGEKIPKLEDVLTQAIDSTNLKFVWLDIKGDPDIFSDLAPIVLKAYQLAASKNRKIEILCGLPSLDVYRQFMTFSTTLSPNTQLPSLCEIGLEETVAIKSKVWGPRWTLGYLSDEVAEAQANNISVITWTLNEESFIKKYIQEANFNGILSDYPSIVAYYHYIRE
jgi:glycerophosphoryl diester phosphodiesterase